MRTCGLSVMLCVLIAITLGRSWGQCAQSPSQSQPAQSETRPSINQTDQNQQSSQPEPQKNPERTSPPQTSPQTPAEEPKKEDNPNPVQAVASMTKDAATSGLLKARDWESGWIAGVYVGRRRKLVTLTGQQRREIYLRQTLTTPGAYMKRMFGAGIDQARDVPPQWV